MIFPVSVYQGDGAEHVVRQTIFTDLAKRKFDLLYTRSWLYKIWALLVHRSSRILDLNQMKASVSVRNRHYQGVRTVEIEQIRGSENRTNDFDIHFNPLHRHDKLRWVGIAAAMLQNTSLPLVELIKVGDTYFVRDGHHRISAARALGQKEIDAVVTVWDLN